MTELQDGPEDDVTPLDNFHYLLAEIESAVERGSIDWNAAAAGSALRRLSRLTEAMGRIAADLG